MLKRNALDEEIDEESKENPFYCKKFSKYLLRTVLPYSCLGTHVMFGVSADTRDEDNQAYVELYFRSLKHDENMKNGPMKIGRYIREMRRIVDGEILRCNPFSELKNVRYRP